MAQCECTAKCVYNLMSMCLYLFFAMEVHPTFLLPFNILIAFLVMSFSVVSCCCSRMNICVSKSAAVQECLVQSEY